MFDFSKLKPYSPVVLRAGLGLVLLWFGFQEVTNTSAWVGWVPSWVATMSPISVETLVILNGSFELLLGTLLLLGLFLPVISFLVALHMFGIVISVGYNEIGIRDFGIFMAAVALFFSSKSPYSLDSLRK